MALPGNPRGKATRCISPGSETGRRRAISVVAALPVPLSDHADRATPGRRRRPGRPEPKEATAAPVADGAKTQRHPASGTPAPQWATWEGRNSGTPQQRQLPSSASPTLNCDVFALLCVSRSLRSLRWHPAALRCPCLSCALAVRPTAARHPRETSTPRLRAPPPLRRSSSAPGPRARAATPPRDRRTCPGG